jgi:hypothetical protein
MSYFSNFPLIEYDALGDNKRKLITNLLKRVNIKSVTENNAVAFDKFDVAIGDKPEDVAYNYYGDAKLHWVVLMVNDVHDRYYDWPMSVQAFEDFLSNKYENPDAIHHYEIEQESGNTSVKINIGTDNTDYPSAVSISNRQYEEEIQERKGQIKLLRPQFITQVTDELQLILEE